MRLPVFALIALSCGLSACAGLAPSFTDAKIEQLVAEDDQVRIAETRVRGQTQRLTVQPKNGAKAYEITPATGGQDLSRAKDGSGQRVWSVLSF